MNQQPILAIFVEIDNCLTTTKSGRKFPLHSEDWIINYNVIEYIKELQKKQSENIKIILCEDGRKLLKGYYNEKSIINKIVSICKKVEMLLNKKSKELCYNISLKNEKYYQIPNCGNIIEDILEYELNINNCLFIVGSTDFIKLAKNCNINYIIK